MSIASILPINGKEYNIDPEDEIREGVAKGIDINEIIEGGNNALHYAIRKGWMDYIEVLIECGIDVNKINDKGNTAADIAGFMDRWPEFERMEATIEPKTVIKMARSNTFNYTIVLMITQLENQERLNETDEETGETIMKIYADNKNKKAAKVVLNHGGDPYVKDKKGESVREKYPEMCNKTMMKFRKYLDFNRFNRKISRYIKEDCPNIRTPQGLMAKLKPYRRDGNTYYNIAVEIVEHYRMHRLGVIMIRVVPMMMLWRKRATERLYHPDRMNFNIKIYKC